VAPESARPDIEKHGIDFSRGTPKWKTKQTSDANFLWTNPRSAYVYKEGVNTLSRSDDTGNWADDSGQNYDVYEVNLPKINRPELENDPEFLFGESVRTTQPIPRRFVRRIG
jgi:hypothetical protein